MKKLIFILSLLFSIESFTQDIGINGSYSPNPIVVGGTSTLSVNFNQNAFVPYPVGSVWVQVTFPSNYTPVGAPSGDFMTYFSTFSDLGGGNWYGLNTQVIPALLSGGFVGLTLNMTVEGVTPTAGAVTNFGCDFELATLFDIEDSDNNTTGGLQVQAPMPITLSSFTGTSVECDHVSLQWATASEINNEYMEILRSSDGKEFLSIGKVAGTNEAGGSKYSMEDHNYLLPNAKYYYVIRQVDFDGRMTHHEVIAVDHTCKDVPFGIDVYPNPATDKIHIALTGFGEDTEVKLQIVNNEGSLLRSISVNTSSVQDVSLDDLQAGIYQIQSTNLEDRKSVV